MTEKPILFSGHMVRALLSGRKTQTRRIVKPQPLCEWSPRVGRYNPVIVDRHGEEGPGPEIFGAADEEFGVRCRFEPGTTLWVRETWQSNTMRKGEVYYAADHADSGLKWRPSIFMPRWASRLTLRVTDVRVERVQEISEEDARAEGCPTRTYRDGRGFESSRLAFEHLWDSINAKRPGCSWADSPWVWVVEFDNVTERGHCAGHEETET